MAREWHWPRNDAIFLFDPDLHWYKTLKTLDWFWPLACNKGIEIANENSQYWNPFQISPSHERWSRASKKSRNTFNFLFVGRFAGRGKTRKRFEIAKVFVKLCTQMDEQFTPFFANGFFSEKGEKSLIRNWNHALSVFLGSREVISNVMISEGGWLRWEIKRHFCKIAVQLNS